MIFVDTSAIVAILLAEQDARALSAAIEAEERRFTSAVVRLETVMLLGGAKKLPPDRANFYFDGLVDTAKLEEIAIDRDIANLAVECFSRYGKGRHAAKLNFGDCLSYACAKSLNAKLLYKGDDFGRTDIAR